MKFFCILLIAFLTSSAFAQSERAKQEVLRRVAEQPFTNFATVSAKLRLTQDVERAYRQLDTLLARPYGDMFWMYGCAGLYFATRDILRPAYKQRIRECWKRFTPYRGDTENHFLMYYGSLFLMTEEWPDLEGSEWFTGQSSKEIHRDAAEYLNHWIDETARYGQVEFNSPRYDYYYITPLILLSEYTRDSTMRLRFTMMLDLTLADYAVEYLNGSYCGAHSRVSDQAAIDPSAGEVTAYGEYFFEDSIKHLEPDLAFAAMSKYECPQVIREIANDREKPFENYETKRGRTTIRNSDIRNAPVFKYDYMTKDFALGSMQGGIVQPIQQQSWSLVFNSTKPHNIITGLNPYFSADELGEFFPEEPSFMLERIGSVKAGYKDENKWVGGSPYEKIYQNKNQLVALYHLPDSVTYHHVDLYIPTMHDEVDGEQSVDTSELHPPGWRFYKFDSTLIGVDLFAQYRIIKENTNLRIRMYDSSSGYLIYCQSAREISLRDFVYKLLYAKLDSDSTHIYSKRDAGATIDIPLKREQPADWLYHSPFLTSGLGYWLIKIEHQVGEAGNLLELDFRQNKRTSGPFTIVHRH